MSTTTINIKDTTTGTLTNADGERLKIAIEKALTGNNIYCAFICRNKYYFHIILKFINRRNR